MSETNVKTFKKVILSGGGTGGSVTPILAIASAMARDYKNLKFIFVGTDSGPEKEMLLSLKNLEIEFLTLPAGKWRRYFSLNNFFDLFKIISAFFKSRKLLKDEKPDLIITAGSFASVPLVYAAACKKLPILVHQQDVKPGLANKLMAPFARIITVVFEKSLVDYGPKAVLTGNPIIIPENLTWPEEVPEHFLGKDKPLVLFIGGGTGALALNDLVFKTKDKLQEKARLVHLTGRGKISAEFSDNYIPLEFLDNKKVLALMQRADIVVSRCGLAVLTELSVLKKASILIPMPATHQEDNAETFSRLKAAIVLNQNNLSVDEFTETIFNLLDDKNKRQELESNISHIMKRDAAASVAAIAWEMIKI
jgi:UDP-N-acetylglucosamine--N-acetylmuramyl-(pentapeptide) pyrophosphoryl-undecaprenol N-acetylglucosamine transferase